VRRIQSLSFRRTRMLSKSKEPARTVDGCFLRIRIFMCTGEEMCCEFRSSHSRGVFLNYQMVMNLFRRKVSKLPILKTRLRKDKLFVKFCSIERTPATSISFVIYSCPAYISSVLARHFFVSAAYYKRGVTSCQTNN